MADRDMQRSSHSHQYLYVVEEHLKCIARTSKDRSEIIGLYLYLISACKMRRWSLTVIITTTSFAAVLMLSCSPARSAETSGAISYQCNVQEYTQESRFGDSLGYVFTDLIRQTPRIAGYNLYVVSPQATGGPPVYGNARCLYSITPEECARCLARAKHLVKSICPSKIGGWVFTGYYCLLRYESYNFN